MDEPIFVTDQDIDDSAPPPPKKYKHTAINRKTGQRLGSNDGRKWFDLRTGEPYPSQPQQTS